MTSKPIFSRGGWKSPQPISNFSGKPLPPDCDLFIEPPREIGKIISAWSEVRVGQTLWPLAVKLLLAGMILILSIGVVAWLKKHDAPLAKPNVAEVVALMLSLCIPAICIAFAFKKKYLAYLGDKGAAVYLTRGTREHASGQIVEFANIANMEEVEHQRDNGWTEWQLKCVDAQGRSLMTLKGKYKVFAGKVMAAPINMIAKAIHTAWKNR